MKPKCLDCNMPVELRERCRVHYYRAMRSGEIARVQIRGNRSLACIGPECRRKPYARDLCNGHYAQMRTGQTLAPLQKRASKYDMKRGGIDAATAASDERIACEVTAGIRCHCGLLLPCTGHEVLSLDWHATRRNGAAGGET